MLLIHNALYIKEFFMLKTKPIRFNRIAAMLMVLIMMVGIMPTTVLAVEFAEDYNLAISGKRINSDNVADISSMLQSGKAYFDPPTRTLILEDAVINVTGGKAEADFGIFSEDFLNIKYKGENRIVYTGTDAAELDEVRAVKCTRALTILGGSDDAVLKAVGFLCAIQGYSLVIDGGSISAAFSGPSAAIWSSPGAHRCPIGTYSDNRTTFKIINGAEVNVHYSFKPLSHMIAREFIDAIFTYGAFYLDEDSSLTVKYEAEYPEEDPSAEPWHDQIAHFRSSTVNGIRAGSITIEGDVDIDIGLDAVDTCGMYAADDAVTISGGRIRLAAAIGIFANESINFNGGDIHVAAYEGYGVCSNDKISFGKDLIAFVVYRVDDAHSLSQSFDAVRAYNGITVDPWLCLTDPKGGELSADEKYFVDSYGDKAEKVALLPLVSMLVSRNGGAYVREYWNPDPMLKNIVQCPVGETVEVKVQSNDASRTGILGLGGTEGREPHAEQYCKYSGNLSEEALAFTFKPLDRREGLQSEEYHCEDQFTFSYPITAYSGSVGKLGRLQFETLKGNLTFELPYYKPLEPGANRIEKLLVLDSAGSKVIPGSKDFPDVFFDSLRWKAESSDPDVITDVLIMINESSGFSLYSSAGLKPGSAEVTVSCRGNLSYNAARKTFNMEVLCPNCAEGTPDEQYLTPVEAKASSCKTRGWDGYWECQTCGRLYGAKGDDGKRPLLAEVPYRPLDPDNHNHVNVDVVDDDPAMCSMIRNYFAHCNDCGNDLIEQGGKDPNIHYASRFTEVEGREATCTEPGIKAHYVCSDCGGKYAKAVSITESIATTSTKDAIEDTVIPAKGHKWVEKVDAEYLKSAADCENPAVYYKSCEYCGLSSKELYDLRAAAANFVPGSAETVTIDGVEFYILAVDDGKALLLTKDVIGDDRQFGSSGDLWILSDLRTWLNGEWLEGMPVLKNIVNETEISTITENFASFSTYDKVFLLSAADVFDNDVIFTYNYAKLPAPGGSWVAYDQDGTEADWWLRSIHPGWYGYTYAVTQSGSQFSMVSSETSGVRPAMWVRFDDPTPEWQTRIESITPGSAETVTIDGVEFHVLAKDDGKALLLTKDVESLSPAAGIEWNSNKWMDTGIRTYLNGEWLAGKPVLKTLVKETEIKTRTPGALSTDVRTQDKVFLLSEADVFDTVIGIYYAPSSAVDYTYNSARLPAPGRSWVAYEKISGNAYMWALRSPGETNHVRYVANNGSCDSFDYRLQGAYGVRPAMWIQYKEPEWQVKIENTAPGAADTVTIDGVEFHVLAKDAVKGRALLLTKDFVKEAAFDQSSNKWEESDIRAWLGDEWLDGMPTLKANAAETAIKTRVSEASQDFVTTNDKVFLLSEADVFGTHNNSSANVKPDDYTYNGMLPAPGGNWNTYNGTDSDNWHLRTPGFISSYNVHVRPVFHYFSKDVERSQDYVKSELGVRPAVWIQYREPVPEPETFVHGDALGHDWGTASYDWSYASYETPKGCTASHTCKRCGHTETEDAKVTSEQTKDPTCTAQGQITFTATFTKAGFKNQQKYRFVAKLEHDWQNKVEDKHLKTAADCTNAAVYFKSCKTCGANHNSETFTHGDALGHSFGPPVYTWGPGNSTCTAQRTCTRENCNHGEFGTATVTDKQTANPTCTGEGQITYTARFTNPAFATQYKYVGVAMLEHDWGETVDAKYLKTAADCTNAAVYYKSCKTCDIAHDTETFNHGDPLGHSFAKPAYSWETLRGSENRTCTAKRECERKGCDHFEEEKATVSVAKTTDPTCTEKGQYTYTAAFKNTAFETQYDYSDIPELGHEWVEKAEDKYLKTAADCTNAAVYYKSCSRCDEKHNSYTFVHGEPLGHKWVNMVDAKYLESAATCTNAAVYFKSCEHCNIKHDTDTFNNGDPLGHDYGDWYVVVKATDRQKGLKRHDCTREGCEHFETSETDMVEYKLELEESDGGKTTVEPADPQSGDGVKITVEPEEDKRVKEITVTDDEGNVIEITDNGNGEYEFTMPEGDVKIVVEYEPKPAVTVDENEGGKTEVEPEYPDAGDEVKITVTPEEDKRVKEITVTDKDGNKIDVTDKGNGEYEFTMPEGDVKIVVEYEPKPTVTVDENEGGKTVIGPKHPDTGDRVDFTVTPEEDQRVKEIKVIDKDGNVIDVTDKGNGEYEFTMPDSDVTIEVEYEPKPVVSVEENEGGKTVVGPKHPDTGDEVDFTVTPEDGKKIKEITVTDKEGNKIDVTDKGNGGYVFTMPDSDVTIEVVYESIVKPSPEIPPTGDNSKLLLWLMLMCISGIGVIATSLKGKKRKHNS